MNVKIDKYISYFFVKVFDNKLRLKYENLLKSFVDYSLCTDAPSPKKIRQRDVCEATHIYRMKTLSCIGDAQLALGAQDTPEEGKECVTYPCYPRPNKTPVVLISYPNLTLFYTWP